MTTRKFSHEFKIEAVKLVAERGVAIAQACWSLADRDGGTPRQHAEVRGFAEIVDRLRRKA